MLWFLRQMYILGVVVESIESQYGSWSGTMYDNLKCYNADLLSLVSTVD